MNKKMAVRVPERRQDGEEREVKSIALPNPGQREPKASPSTP